jgi:hypothetical protein
MLVDWLQKPSVIIWGIYLAVAELFSCLPSYSFSCVLVSEEDHPKNNSGNQTCATVHEPVFRLLRFIWVHADRDNINAFAAVAVAIFTFTLWRSTLKLWEAGEKQRESNERIAALQRHSSEKIGEAQVRAYVNIKSAGMDFLLGDIHPRILFVAYNSGQSPARNFIWNITLQYVGLPINRESVFNENWLEGAGMDISASSDAPPTGAIIPNMSVKQFIEGPAPGVLISMVRVKIEFRFADVFERDWFGETFFAGTMQKKQISLDDLQQGVSPWVGDIFPIAKPCDWDEIRKAENT